MKKLPLHSLIAVIDIRIVRAQKTLNFMLIELSETREKFSLAIKKEQAWKRKKTEWECEFSSANSLALSVRNRVNVCAKIDSIDGMLAREIQERRLLEADLHAIEEQCRLQRKIIMKQNKLKEIFQEKIGEIVQHHAENCSR
ncbi:hypothetical protein V8G57_17145 [Collimonas sp. H4R21]|uniref:Flagellar FliJ protein n=1 Tax=Collimonas rhizosphaerae TaxID=3126357 RepID=A0ABU9PYQ7_9BURK